MIFPVCHFSRFTSRSFFRIPVPLRAKMFGSNALNGNHEKVCGFSYARDTEISTMRVSLPITHVTWKPAPQKRCPDLRTGRKAAIDEKYMNSLDNAKKKTQDHQKSKNTFFVITVFSWMWLCSRMDFVGLGMGMCFICSRSYVSFAARACRSAIKTLEKIDPLGNCAVEKILALSWKRVKVDQNTRNHQKHTKTEKLACQKLKTPWK